MEGVGEMLPGMQHQHPHSFHTFIIPLPSTCPTQPCCYSTAVFCADGRFSGLRAIACGGWHCAALSTTGEVYTWGWNRFGQLGCGDRNLSPLPHLLPQVLLTRGQAREREVNFDQVRHSIPLAEVIAYNMGFAGWCLSFCYFFLRIRLGPATVTPPRCRVRMASCTAGARSDCTRARPVKATVLCRREERR